MLSLKPLEILKKIADLFIYKSEETMEFSLLWRPFFSMDNWQDMETDTDTDTVKNMDNLNGYYTTN
jgi:hypothetical protein